MYEFGYSLAALIQAFQRATADFIDRQKPAAFIGGRIRWE